MKTNDAKRTFMPNQSQPKSLILCIHAHQPIGNFDHVFNEAFEKSYKPFFEVVEKHPNVPICCHFSGCLIDWLEIHKPEFIEKLRMLNDRGQLEFVGGAYYEPIYGLIPKKDLAGQIQMMREKIHKLFGVTPEGAWLTERVWDPDLTVPLRKAGVLYTILDDLHFEKAGLPASIAGYYKTTAEKSTVDLFASMKQLRYLMPFRRAEETVEFIKNTDAKPEDVFVFADDCEKFGMWPGTYDWVYKQGWLDRLFTLLEKEPSIKISTFSQFRKKYSPKKQIKIPHASYSEMMEWSGGSFYDFFKKYPESRYMRDRMWDLSSRLAKMSLSNGAFEKFEKAREFLYKAQCNCSYWHGVFGGLYLHHLRSAVFENLIKAESVCRSAIRSKARKDAVLIEPRKLDTALHWQIRQKEISSFFNPAYGGATEELDELSKSVNLMCNIDRRREAYHDSVLKKVAGPAKTEPLSIHEMLGTKEKNLEKFLFYDTNRRLGFLDHFFEEEASPDQFLRSSCTEAGDFITAPYESRASQEGKTPVLVFNRTGAIRLGGRRFRLELEKTIIPQGAHTLKVRYRIKNLSKTDIHFVFGNEFNFSIGEPVAVKGLHEKKIKEWIFNDSWRGLWIKLFSKEEVSLIAQPVETVSESESGLEKTYQELGVLLQRPIFLKAGQTREHVLELAVSSTSS